MIRSLPAERLGLRPLAAGAPSDTSAPSVQLHFDGRPAAQALPGARLEAAFDCAGLGDAQLQLLDQAETRLPFLGDPPGVHRRFGFHRRLRLSAQPDR